MTTLAPGDPCPPLRLPDPDGIVHDLADAVGRPTLVLFACNHCPYVKHVAPELGRLAKGWTAAGVHVVAVNSNSQTHPGDAPDRMAPFAATHGWAFPYLVDAEQSVARAFGAACTPDVFLFDAAHRLAYCGQIDSSRPGNEAPVTGEDLASAVQAVLNRRPVDLDVRPSVGCGIKWLTEPS